MKRYEVIVMPEAASNIREAFDFIYDRSPLNAARWLKALYQKINTLETLPHRCPPAPERRFVDEELRHLLFKSHRIIFRVNEAEAVVAVLHVRHAKRLAVGEELSDSTN